MLVQVLAQATSPQGGGGYTQIIFFVGIAVVFYFFMIRPQQKKQKDQKKFLEEIKKGDAVVTIGGMHGKVHSLDDAKITLEVDKGTKLIFERSSISLEASNKK
jgi:preprotein translocase subunit YajC